MSELLTISQRYFEKLPWANRFYTHHYSPIHFIFMFMFAHFVHAPVQYYVWYFSHIFHSHRSCHIVREVHITVPVLRRIKLIRPFRVEMYICELFSGSFLLPLFHYSSLATLHYSPRVLCSFSIFSRWMEKLFIFTPLKELLFACARYTYALCCIYVCL